MSNQRELREYHDNGQLREYCTYSNGRLNGPYKTWYMSGQMSSHCYYIYEERHSIAGLTDLDKLRLSLEHDGLRWLEDTGEEQSI